MIILDVNLTDKKDCPEYGGSGFKKDQEFECGVCSKWIKVPLEKAHTIRCSCMAMLFPNKEDLQQCSCKEGFSGWVSYGPRSSDG